MKLSYKFFCIAYIIVLLATGVGGILVINNVNNTLWNTQVERVKTTVNYVADSFLAFADVSYSEITGTHKNNIVRQIKDSLDNSVVEIEIHTSQNATSEYTEIDDNKCVSQFIKKDDLILMESVCKIGTEADVYYLVIYSDFTEIQKQCGLFWNSYGIVVFIISVISGLLILASAKKITKPLSLLTKVSDEVALGNYGKKVDVKSSDYEITALSESFNSMSLAIEQKIKEIREESEKRNIFVADFTQRNENSDDGYHRIRSNVTFLRPEYNGERPSSGSNI